MLLSIENRIKMSIGKTFLKELVAESEVTRRYLTSVSFDQKDFKPSEKSESLGRLAIHIAEITAWWSSCIKDHSLDFIDFKPKNIQSTKELLSYFDHLLETAKQDLSEVLDETFEQEWSMKYGEEVLFKLPKRQVARIFCMNHQIHHRAQLGVYFRILGNEIPAAYGPSADNDNVTLINPFY